MKRSGHMKQRPGHLRGSGLSVAAMAFAGLLALLVSGCAVQQAFQIRPKSCLNPWNGLDPEKAECFEDEQDSRPMELRIYPLSGCPEASTLKWDDLVEPSSAQSKLKDLWLEDPETRLIERLQDSSLERKYPTKTKCFLVVAIGRAGGPESLEVVKYRRLHRDLTVTVERYNLFVTNTLKTD